MVRRYLQKKQESSKSKPTMPNSDVRELYLLEKLYEAIRNDKGRITELSAREFYLLERLYEAIRSDKNRNEKLMPN
jgi:ribosomal silencing factor RsfS